MKRDFSIYLDLVRFCAAIAVLLSHITGPEFTSMDLHWRIGAYGFAGVVVFFMLSGFVIAHTINSREGDARAYFSSRAARLYSVVLIALPLTYLLDTAGIYFNPELYQHPSILLNPESIRSYVYSLFFVNEWLGINSEGIAPGTNGPYWSLSFEATYYVIAGITLFMRRSLAIPILAFVLYVAGPTITALLPIWLFGYLIYEWRGLTLSKPVALALFLISIFAILQCPPLAKMYGLRTDNFGYQFPWGRGRWNRDLLTDYALAASFAVHLIAARNLFTSNVCWKMPEKVIRWLGSLTFTLYLLHVPLICFLQAITPFPDHSALNLAFILSGTFIVVIIVAPLTDVLKIKIKAFLSAKPLFKAAIGH